MNATAMRLHAMSRTHDERGRHEIASSRRSKVRLWVKHVRCHCWRVALSEPFDWWWQTCFSVERL